MFKVLQSLHHGSSIGMLIRPGMIYIYKLKVDVGCCCYIFHGAFLGSPTKLAQNRLMIILPDLFGMMLHTYWYCIVYHISYVLKYTHTQTHRRWHTIDMYDMVIFHDMYGSHIYHITHIDTHTHSNSLSLYLSLSLSLHSPIITYAMVIPSMSQGDERGGRTPLGWRCFHDGAALVMVWCWDTGRDKTYQQIMDI